MSHTKVRNSTDNFNIMVIDTPPRPLAPSPQVLLLVSVYVCACVHVCACRAPEINHRVLRRHHLFFLFQMGPLAGLELPK